MAGPLQFATFTSEIELPFYSNLFASKLDYDKLDDSARRVSGLYEQRYEAPEVSCRMQILGNALTSNQVPFGAARAEGSIRNVNTMDAFRNMDKGAMLQRAANTIWNAINDGTIYSSPSLLSSFIILSYADLKKYKFTYWFAYPAIHSDPAWRRSGPAEKLTSAESIALVERVGTWRYSVDGREHGFFLAKKVPGPNPEDAEDDGEERMSTLPYHWKVDSLRAFEDGFFSSTPAEDQYICFTDPSTYAEGPGWPLRNLLVLIRQRYKLTKCRVICFRDTQPRRHEARSVILPLEMDPIAELHIKTMPKVTGWERARNGKLQAQQANLGEYMDPVRLADSSVDLNLKLMKWRIAPELDLDRIKRTKCLLLGAGTLGGYVSRNLMGWGVRKITFVDYGKVSYSNPVRQPLFEFDDCTNGGQPKAPRAAEALRRIYPGVDSEGHSISVPMLGHPFTDEAKTKEDLAKLEQLIDEHDVIFLLMDTRESRWLPTVIGKAKGKIVMNAALGFDSYVVMRHGAEKPAGEDVPGLGCYFCNDVVAPADSMKDQTLDQQCTVTRPGVAAIASALLVEMLTSLLQHPLLHHAPAPQPTPTQPNPPRDPPTHPLGLVPHQIRGYVSTFNNIIIRGQSYDSCSACSPKILAAYRNGGWEGFVRRALMEKGFVSEVSGLAEVQRRAEELDGEVDWEEEESGVEEGEGELL